MMMLKEIPNSCRPLIELVHIAVVTRSSHQCLSVQGRYEFNLALLIELLALRSVQETGYVASVSMIYELKFGRVSGPPQVPWLNTRLRFAQN